MDAALGSGQNVRAQARRGSVAPLEQTAEWILAFVAEQSDLTLDEIVSAMHKKRICGSRTALWRFLARHDITVKKSLRAAEQQRADVARARRRWIREQGLLDPARDRKSTRLNSSHTVISYAVFCLKKKQSTYPRLLR